MKKIITLFILIIPFILKGQGSDVIGIYHASQYIGDEYFSDIPLSASIIYSDSMVYLDVDGSTRSVKLMLSEIERLRLILHINKFKEWAYLADSLNIEHTKVIGYSDCDGAFKYGDEYYINFGISVKFIFHSKILASDMLCTFEIEVPRLVASDNKYIDIPSRSIYLSDSQVNELLMSISSESIKKLSNMKKEKDDIFK